MGCNFEVSYSQLVALINAPVTRMYTDQIRINIHASLSPVLPNAWSCFHYSVSSELRFLQTQSVFTGRGESKIND